MIGATIKTALAALTVSFFLSGAAWAQTTITQPVTDFGASYSDGNERIGQVVTVPADNRLDSWTINVNHNGVDFVVRPLVYLWDGTQMVGAPVYSGAPVTVTNAAPAQAYTFNTGGVTLIAGQQYVLLGQFETPGGLGTIRFNSGGGYAGGSLVSGNLLATALTPSPSDLQFTAEFSPAPVVTIPTLSEWAMILLALALGGAAALILSRRRMA